MSSTVITARLPEEDVAALDKLAAATDRSRAWIVAKAVKRYVDDELAFRAFVQVGIDDIEAGRFVTQDEMEAEFIRRGATLDAA